MKYTSTVVALTDLPTLICTGVPVITAARDVMRCCPSSRSIGCSAPRLAFTAADSCVGTCALVSHSRIEPDG